MSARRRKPRLCGRDARAPGDAKRAPPHCGFLTMNDRAYYALQWIVNRMITRR